MALVIMGSDNPQCFLYYLTLDYLGNRLNWRFAHGKFIRVLLALTAGGEGREERKEERLAEPGCGFNKVLGQSYRDLWSWDDPSESSCLGAKKNAYLQPHIHSWMQWPQEAGRWHDLE